MLKLEVASHMDPLKFAYRQGRSTEDASLSVTHLISKHLDHPKAYTRVLFADFSSAFNTVQRHLLVRKSHGMHINPFSTKCLPKVNGTLSEIKHCSKAV